MLKISFECVLENGLHARPASELEKRLKPFNSRFTLHNLRNQRQADARSVLGIIGADVLFQDCCELIIEGDDEQQALQALQGFLHEELAHCDAPAFTVTTVETPLPVFLSQTDSPCIRGSGVSPGLAAGKTLLFGSVDLSQLAREAQPQLPEQQQVALGEALQSARRQLQDQLATASGELGLVLQAHLTLLDDPEVTTTLFGIKPTRNALETLVHAVEKLCLPLRESQSRYLQQRVLDVEDLGMRMAGFLCGKTLQTCAELNQPTVIISSSPLTPGQFLSVLGPHLKGIVTGEGGETSHTVILARSFNVPLLCVESAELMRIGAGENILIDSHYGVVVISPDTCALRWQRLEEEKLQRIAHKLAPTREKPGEMADGTRVAVLANIALAAEAQNAFEQGAEGIGLFRTEMLFCERAARPSEQEQYQVYRQVLEQAKGRKVVIRTLDIGGDKPCDYLVLPREDNPFLGCRGIRLYPTQMNLFLSQVRALLRASAHGSLHIMAPMVTTLAEILWLREQFTATQAQLHQEGLETGRWTLGIMAEVPSVLYLLEKCAPYINFVSIGSNDLAQYFFACDRGNSQVRGLSNPRDPAFLALIKDFVTRAQRAGLEISLCGEMAGDASLLPLLSGTGLRQLSMSASRIGETKSRLAALTLADCQQVLNDALVCEGPKEVDVILQKPFIQSSRSVIDPALILIEPRRMEKAEVIKRLTDNLEVEQRTVSGSDIEASIWQREAIFPTALGFSVALPHCKSSAVRHSSISVMRLASPLRWSDDVDVSLVIMLTVSEQEKADHMKIFSRLARRLMHEDFRESLQQSAEPERIAALLRQELDL